MTRDKYPPSFQVLLSADPGRFDEDVAHGARVALYDLLDRHPDLTSWAALARELGMSPARLRRLAALLDVDLVIRARVGK